MPRALVAFRAVTLEERDVSPFPQTVSLDQNHFLNLLLALGCFHTGKILYVTLLATVNVEAVAASVGGFTKFSLPQPFMAVIFPSATRGLLRLKKQNSNSYSIMLL